MNNVSLVGRLARDPDVRYIPENQKAVARFTVAVDRPMAKEKQADFISCAAFGKTAEFIDRYFSKGKAIGLQGHIQTGSYTNKDGTKVYTTDVIVERVEFVGSKSDGEKPEQRYDDDIPAGFMAMDDDDMPFG